MAIVYDTNKINNRLNEMFMMNGINFSILDSTEKILNNLKLRYNKPRISMKTDGDIKKNDIVSETDYEISPSDIGFETDAITSGSEYTTASSEMDINSDKQDISKTNIDDIESVDIDDIDDFELPIVQPSERKKRRKKINKKDEPFANYNVNNNSGVDSDSENNNEYNTSTDEEIDITTDIFSDDDNNQMFDWE